MRERDRRLGANQQGATSTQAKTQMASHGPPPGFQVGPASDISTGEFISIFDITLFTNRLHTCMMDYS